MNYVYILITQQLLHFLEPQCLISKAQPGTSKSRGHISKKSIVQYNLDPTYNVSFKINIESYIVEVKLSGVLSNCFFNLYF